MHFLGRCFKDLFGGESLRGRVVGFKLIDISLLLLEEGISILSTDFLTDDLRRDFSTLYQ
jgi:hypothetical protein